MAEYEERYKIVFDMDAAGGGVNINVQGGSAGGASAGISQTSAGGAGGLMGAIANSITNIAAGKVGISKGKISSSTSLAEKVRNFRRSSGGFGAPSDAMTGRGTTEIGYGRGQMNPVDLSRNKWRAWNQKDKAYGDAESDFAKAVRSKGWDKNAIIESARKRWAVTDAKPQQVEIPKYEGYNQNQQPSLISETQINPKYIIRSSEYTRK